MPQKINHAREMHFDRMQKTLEEGLRAIRDAATPADAEAARMRARRRMEELNRMFAEAFPDQT